MIQTLEAEIDEKGSVRLVVIPDQPCEETDDIPDDWKQPYVD